MIYMLWKESIPPKFYKHIWEENNFLYLNGKNVLQPKVLEIIPDFQEEDEENYKDLRKNLSSYKNIFQYVYSNVFSETHCSIEWCAFDLKNNFHDVFKTYKDKNNLEISLRKNPENCETIRNETSVFGQKHIKLDDFNEIEEKDVKELVVKRKQKQRDLAESNKLLKKSGS